MKLSLVILLLVVALITIAKPHDVGNSVATERNTNLNSTLELACVTGKATPGICVQRERCDYGTWAIDFTLYRPRGFKSACSPGEVCCPQDSLVQDYNKHKNTEEGEFEFDEDD